MLGLGDKVNQEQNESIQTERKKIPRGKSISLIQSQYVEKYLAKPRQYQQKNKLDIEYEKQKENCTFKPELYKKSTGIAVQKQRRSKAARSNTSKHDVKKTRPTSALVEKASNMTKQKF